MPEPKQMILNKEIFIPIAWVTIIIASVSWLTTMFVNIEYLKKTQDDQARKIDEIYQIVLRLEGNKNLSLK